MVRGLRTWQRAKVQAPAASEAASELGRRPRDVAVARRSLSGTTSPQATAMATVTVSEVAVVARGSSARRSQAPLDVRWRRKVAEEGASTARLWREGTLGSPGTSTGHDEAYHRARRASAILHAWNSAAFHLLEVLRLNDALSAGATAAGSVGGSGDVVVWSPTSGTELFASLSTSLPEDDAAAVKLVRRHAAAIATDCCLQVTAVAHRIVAALLTIESSNVDVCARVVFDACAVLRRYARDASYDSARSDDSDLGWASRLPHVLRQPLVAAIGDVFMLAFRLHRSATHGSGGPPSVAVKAVAIKWIAEAPHVLALLAWLGTHNTVWALPIPPGQPSTAASVLRTLGLGIDLPALLSRWNSGRASAVAAAEEEALAVSALCYAYAVATVQHGAAGPKAVVPAAPVDPAAASMPHWHVSQYRQRLGDALNVLGQGRSMPGSFAPEVAARLFSLAVDLFESAGDADNALTARANVSHVMRVAGTVAASAPAGPAASYSDVCTDALDLWRAVLGSRGDSMCDKGSSSAVPAPAPYVFSLPVAAYQLLLKAAQSLARAPPIVADIANPHTGTAPDTARTPAHTRALEGAGSALLLLACRLSGAVTATTAEAPAVRESDVMGTAATDPVLLLMVLAGRAFVAARNGKQVAATVYQCAQHCVRIAPLRLASPIAVQSLLSDLCGARTAPAGGSEAAPAPYSRVAIVLMRTALLLFAGCLDVPAGAATAAELDTLTGCGFPVMTTLRDLQYPPLSACCDGDVAATVADDLARAHIAALRAGDGGSAEGPGSAVADALLAAECLTAVASPRAPAPSIDAPAVAMGWLREELAGAAAGLGREHAMTLRLKGAFGALLRSASSGDSGDGKAAARCQLPPALRSAVAAVAARSDSMWASCDALAAALSEHL